MDVIVGFVCGFIVCLALIIGGCLLKMAEDLGRRRRTERRLHECRLHQSDQPPGGEG